MKGRCEVSGWVVADFLAHIKKPRTYLPIGSYSLRASASNTVLMDNMNARVRILLWL